METSNTNVNDTRDTGVDPELLEGIGFIGQVLGPFFLQDPERGSAQEAYEALASLDVEQAGAEWPFVDGAQAAACLSLMQQGVAQGMVGLGEEYRRLFVGPFKKVAPPWGSVYTDKDCVIFGRSTLALREWMHANAIARSGSDAADPDDHIGYLLAMLPWLTVEKPELVAEFLRDHVLTWSSHFFDIVENETTQPFYKGLARLSKASLEGAGAALGLKVELPRFYR